jgi:hypothetical protein
VFRAVRGPGAVCRSSWIITGAPGAQRAWTVNGTVMRSPSARRNWAHSW